MGRNVPLCGRIKHLLVHVLKLLERMPLVVGLLGAGAINSRVGEALSSGEVRDGDD